MPLTFAALNNYTDGMSILPNNFSTADFCKTLVKGKLRPQLYMLQDLSPEALKKVMGFLSRNLSDQYYDSAEHAGHPKSPASLFTEDTETAGMLTGSKNFIRKEINMFQKSAEVLPATNGSLALTGIPESIHALLMECYLTSLVPNYDMDAYPAKEHRSQMEKLIGTGRFGPARNWADARNSPKISPTPGFDIE